MTPGKASRSPKKILEAEEVLTASRFLVLAQEEEENIEITEHDQAEEVAKSFEVEDATLLLSN